MTVILEATGVALPGRLSATDLVLKEGEVTCLIGPNGSGKTSLLHALARIGRPEGKVTVGSVDIARVGSERRAGLMAYLPASRDVAWPLLACDAIALGRAGARHDLEGLMRSLDIGDLAARRMDRLSTGERARVLLARALAGEPRVLLLDEPIANLDPLWQIRMMERLAMEAHERGRSVLIAAHDLDMVRSRADRLIVMKDGAIVADGAPEAILDGPVIPATFGVRRAAGAWAPA